jgi:hypothetical protein
MSKPQWLAAELARQGQRLIDGAVTRQEAVQAIGAMATADPEYVAGLIATAAERELTAWLRGAAPGRPSSPQLHLFPEMPYRMKVTPKATADIVTMDAHQLDAAKNILFARTQNAIDGARAAAEHERDVFMDFYRKVRPALHDGMTVADVIGKLAQAARQQGAA